MDTLWIIDASQCLLRRSKKKDEEAILRRSSGEGVKIDLALYVSDYELITKPFT
jgi:hypothetical protein